MNKHRPKCVKIDLNNKVYGGRIYENQIVALLDDSVAFKRVFLLKYNIKLLNIPRIIWLYVKYRFFFHGTLFLTNHTTWFAGNNTRNIIVVHHLDSKLSKGTRYLYQRFCDNFLIANRDRYDSVVTVAKCWQQKLIDIGFNNVCVIYNSFDPNLYSFSKEQIKTFRRKYGFDDRPLIYLGNCQIKKGVVESYNVLNEMDYQLVTSGVKDVELPIPNLNLSFAEYRLLLASSDIVLTMSKFLEGWNRTAHEAVLCGTPVIGSGVGGMRELLEMSDQIICSSFDELPEIVKSKLGSSRKSYRQTLIQYDNLYFKRCWEDIFHK